MGPRILIRPVEPSEVDLVYSWSLCPDWPVNAMGSQRIDNTKSEFNEIFVAERVRDRKPIGISHLSGMNLAPWQVQFSVCIPYPELRAPGRGWDLQLLSIGAAFNVYEFSCVVIAVDEENRSVLQMARKAGFRARVKGGRLHELVLDRGRWERLWQEQFLQKASLCPWLAGKLGLGADSHSVFEEAVSNSAGREVISFLQLAESRKPIRKILG